MSKGEGNSNFMDSLVEEMNAFLDKELKEGVEPNPDPEVVAQINKEIAESRVRLESYRLIAESFKNSIGFTGVPSVDREANQENVKMSFFVDVDFEKKSDENNGAAE